MVQRNFLVGRARHRKRLPQVLDEDDAGNIPGPVTLTFTTIQQPISSNPVVTPTVTVFVPPPETTLSSSSLPLPSSPAPAPIPSPGTTLTSMPTPSVFVNNNGPKTDTAAPSGAASSQGIPTGSIVGIVLAIVLFIIAGAIFLLRQRAVANRLKMRGWANKQNNPPSFLWIDPKEAKGAAPIPNMSSISYHEEPAVLYGSLGPFQPSYAPTNNGLPFIPPPAPPRPPPAAGLYDYPDSPPMSVAPSVPYALTPGGGSSRVPPLSTPAPAPSVSKPVGSAKVKSTFIPTLPDELSISTGEEIRVHAEYDDGWALCSNTQSEIGMVPLECLDIGPAPPDAVWEHKKLARASSLAATGAYGGYQ